jgi:hypothetical protein
MGLKLRINLFYQVQPQYIYGTYVRFYSARGFQILEHHENPSRRFQFTLYELDNDWCVLALDEGWEWKLRREAQLFASKELLCPGFLIFVYDGDYWGYEFFNNGIALDHFVQETEDALAISWFPDEPISGNAEVIAAHIPSLAPERIVPYLVHKPWSSREEWTRLDVPAQPSDVYSRFDECAVLDFLRQLGIRVEIRDGYVTFLAREWRSFFIRPKE